MCERVSYVCIYIVTLVQLTASGTNDEATGLDEEAFHVALATFPMMHGEATDVAYKAEGGEWGVKEEGEEAATVTEIPKIRGCLLGRHEYHERLTKVSRYLLEHVTVVRVDDDEEGLPREWIQVAWIETVRFLSAGRPLAVFRIAFTARRYATEVVTHLEKIHENPMEPQSYRKAR